MRVCPLLIWSVGLSRFAVDSLAQHTCNGKGSVLPLYTEMPHESQAALQSMPPTRSIQL